MRDLVTALGLVLVIEGLIYAANPAALKRMMAMAQEMPEQTMRICGFIAFGLGFLIVWLARSGL
ncbi:MAG: DUF2065 domain-containing protein [Pseudomonadota bacterium]